MASGTAFLKKARDYAAHVAMAILVIALFLRGGWWSAFVWWMGIVVALDVAYHTQRLWPRLVVRFWSCSFCNGPFVLVSGGGYKCAKGCSDGSA